jgi:cation diffusion facilitator family transporter
MAALSILHSAYLGFLAPKPLDALLKGLAINAAASTINGIWAWLLLRWGLRVRSPALVADGRHVLTDVFTSGGVLVGVALVWVTGWLVLDSVVAALVALNILWSGYVMVRAATGGLMDEAPPPEMLARIKNVIGQHAAGAISPQWLRGMRFGNGRFRDPSCPRCV